MGAQVKGIPHKILARLIQNSEPKRTVTMTNFHTKHECLCATCLDYCMKPMILQVQDFVLNSLPHFEVNHCTDLKGNGEVPLVSI